MMSVYRPSIPLDVRQLVYTRDAFRCVFCASRNKLTLHHVRPLALGGSNEPHNLVVLCNTCHSLIENAIRRLLRWSVPLGVWFVYGPRFWFRLLRLTLRKVIP